jgi:hypothetical protein
MTNRRTSVRQLYDMVNYIDRYEFITIVLDTINGTE